MKKGIIIALGVVLSVLLIVIGINKVKLNKTTPTQSTQSTESYNEDAEEKAMLNATPIEQKEKERIEIKEIGKSKYQSVVIFQNDINSELYRGTGFIVSKNKLLTNKHVTDGFNDTTVARLRNENNEFVNFKVTNIINAPDHSDLSIVEVAPNDNGQNIGDNIQMLEFATQEEINNIKVNDMVHVVGYPGDKEFSTLWYSEGKILYLPPNNSGMTYLDTLTYGGNSGSPLLNKDGKIIGLHNAGNEIKEKGIRVSIGFLLDKDLYEFVMNNI